MKLEQLTFTRFLAALPIFVFHFGLDTPPFDNILWNNFFINSNLGVSYFFILSGFVMIIAYHNKPEINFRDYIKNRFARIAPVYYLAVVLMCLFYIIGEKPFDTIGILLNSTFLQAWVPGYTLSGNYPAWSLSIEAIFYISFPFLFNRYYKKWDIKFDSKLMIILVIWLSYQVIHNIILNTNIYQGIGSVSHDIIFTNPILHLNQFIIGNIAGLIYIKYLKDQKRNFDLAILAISVLIFSALRFDIGLNYYNGLLAVLFIPFIFMICMNNGFITKLFSNRYLVQLGEISFGFYILQLPITIWVWGIIKKLGMYNLNTKFYIPLIVLLLVSYLSYNFIEKPLRNYIKSM